MTDSFQRPTELFIQQGRANPKEISFDGNLIRPNVNLSPDGRHLIVQEQIPASADVWERYNIRRDFSLVRYVVVDTQSGSNRLLLNAPALLGGTVAWLSDSNSVVLVGTYLPQNEMALGQQKAGSLPFTAEINVSSRSVTPIAQGYADLVRWDPASRTIVIRPRPNLTEYGHPVAFQKSASEWVKKDSANEMGTNGHPISVVEEQDMNTPPRVFAINNETAQKKLLMDLNPQFKSLEFGRVEEIAWKGTDGQDQKGGLYLPVGVVAGQKYPVVIQLEGWDAHQFWLDGPSTAGYAAQELAGRGFVVAQVALPPLKSLTNVNEGPTAMCSIEGLIDYLDHRGLIDRTRVGLLGWSRTGYHVRYTLTFSKYPIAAAIIVDGLDASYFQYLSWVNTGEDAGYTYEQINGGDPPFGVGLQSWLKHATGFNLENVHTPVWLIAFRKYSLLNNWEWFAGLRRLGKPVDMVWLPDAEHAPVKPSERLTAQGGAVDWFLFWLKGEQDSDPSKAEQYSRWRGLRQLQEANH